jgi:hypothetical protein
MAHGRLYGMETDIEVIEAELGRPAGEREAFLLWESVCNRKQKCVNEHTKVPIRTLYSWQDKYDWKVEADVGLQEVLQLANDRGKLGFQELLSDAVVRLKKMLADDKADHRDQRENIRLLASIAFMTQADGPNTLIDARSITLNGQHNPQSAIDPFTRATRLLESNVAQTNEERRKGRRKTF